MGLGSGRTIADRFATYVGELTKVIGHADRAGPLRSHGTCTVRTYGCTFSPLWRSMAPQYRRVDGSSGCAASVQCKLEPLRYWLFGTQDRPHRILAVAAGILAIATLVVAVEDWRGFSIRSQAYNAIVTAQGPESENM